MRYENQVIFLLLIISVSLIAVIFIQQLELKDKYMNEEEYMNALTKLNNQNKELRQKINNCDFVEEEYSLLVALDENNKLIENINYVQHVKIK